MATASEIADLLTAGIQGPTGADDSGWHVGRILSWSSTTGLNTVLVNGAQLTNLKALTPSLGTEYAPGQTVLIVRKQTQYFILGPVTVPGAVGSSPPTQIDTAGSTFSGTTDVWRDLDGGAGVSPVMTVKLAPYQRCLFLFGARFVSAKRVEVQGSLRITSPGGANRLATPGVVSGQTWIFGQGANSTSDIQSEGGTFKTFLIQAGRADATPSDEYLMPGSNVVDLKYNLHVTTTGTNSASVGGPWLLAIPF